MGNKYIFLGTLLFGVCLSANAKVVDVCNFGAKTDSKTDCVAAVAKAVGTLQAGDTLIFPTGRYDFFTDNAATKNYYESNTTDVFPKRLAVLLKGLKNIVLDAKNSLWVMHGQIQPLTIDSCENITVKNLYVDWDTPLTAEAQVTQVVPNGFFATIDYSQFPFDIENEQLIFKGEGWRSSIFSAMEFRPYDSLGIAVVEPHTGDVTSWNYNNFKVSRIAGQGLFFKQSKPEDPMPQNGNWLVLRHNERANAGIFVIGAKDVQFENTWLYHTGGLGILCQYSENLTFIRSGVVPNPAKKRYLSGHDDGFHIMGCRGDVVVKYCRWQGLMDDPINIHGTAARVIEIKGKKMLCRFMQQQSVGMQWGQAGNEVGFLDHNTLSTIAKGTIKSYTQISPTDFEIEFVNAVPKTVKALDAIENLYWAPQSVTITNNIFGGNRARGLLLSVGGKVVVENNTFYSSGAAILIAGDANQWYETGGVDNVLIKGNTFMSSCNTSQYQFCGAIISIDPEIPNVDIAKPFHRNITIDSNTFYTANTAIVYAKSVEGLTIKGNTIVETSQFPKAKHELAERFTLVGCSKYVID